MKLFATTQINAPLKNTYHRDGTVTFWSVYQQRWIRTRSISDQELAAMSAGERERVLRHTAATS